MVPRSSRHPYSENSPDEEGIKTKVCVVCAEEHYSENSPDEEGIKTDCKGILFHVSLIRRTALMKKGLRPTDNASESAVLPFGEQP